MKSLLFAFSFLTATLCFTDVLAQTNRPKADETVYQMVEQMPEFPGGQDSLMRFLGRKIKYPEEAIRNNQEGTTYISFVVNATGEIAEPTVLKSAAPSLDAEAIRVIDAMPVWNAGRQNGVPVAVRFILPVRYRLPEEPIYTDVKALETPPQFPGGEKEMFRFIGLNLKYPPEAQRKKISGLVVISFVVNADGSISDYEVLKELGYGTEKEVIRLVQAMPKWQPGIRDGKPVRVRYNLPFRFSIN